VAAKLPKRERIPSTGEQTFITYWNAFGFAGLTYISEYKFHQTRKWRFDFAFPLHMVAVEIEGGSWNGGRHTKGQGFEDDCLKYNAAVELGWKLLRYTPKMLVDDPVKCINQVRYLLGSEYEK